MQQLAPTQATIEAPALIMSEAPEALSAKPSEGPPAPAIYPRSNIRAAKAELVRWLKRLGLYFGAVLAAGAAGLFFLWQIPLLNDLPQLLNNLSDGIVSRPAPQTSKPPVLANADPSAPIAPITPGRIQPSPAGPGPIAAQTPSPNQPPAQPPAPTPAPAQLPAPTPALAPTPATAAAQPQPPTQPPAAPVQTPPPAQAQAPAQTPVTDPALAQAETAAPPATPTGDITVNRALPGSDDAAAAPDVAAPAPPGQTALEPGQIDPAAPPATAAATPAPPNTQQEIQQLLEAARVQMENRRLTSPSSGNALSSYQRVLELEPSNPTAAEGIQRIATYYQDIARQSLQQGRTDEGLAYINRGLRAAPKSEVLLNLRRQVRQAKQREEERRQALLAERQRLEAEQQALQAQPRPRFQDIPPQFQGGSPPVQGGTPFQGAPPQAWRPRQLPPPQQSPRSGDTGFNQR